MALSKDKRQEIVREFAIRHNGTFNAVLFRNEVRDRGESHPAYGWFTWDKDSAADAYQVEQARAFARDLRVVFRIEEVTSPGSVRIHEMPMPVVISPLEGRNKGGGYRLVEPDDPEHMSEHCRQAAKTLEQWLNRYQVAVAHSGVKVAQVQSMIGRLQHAATKAQPTIKAG